MIEKRYDETFWDDRNILILDRDMGYIDVGFVKINGALNGNFKI